MARMTLVTMPARGSSPDSDSVIFMLFRRVLTSGGTMVTAAIDPSIRRMRTYNGSSRRLRTSVVVVCLVQTEDVFVLIFS